MRGTRYKHTLDVVDHAEVGDRASITQRPHRASEMEGSRKWNVMEGLIGPYLAEGLIGP